MEELDFEVISDITDIEIIAVGSRIHDLDRLQRDYGRGRWRKLKGIALVRILKSGRVRQAEVHWYEARGIGRRDLKVKRYLKDRP
jgi:hypothetical protein